MEELTWEKMVELEPRLQEVYERILVARPRSEFKANRLWYGVRPGSSGFKRIMSKLVGYKRVDEDHRGELTSGEAYDIAYRKLYDTLIGSTIGEYDDEEMKEDQDTWEQEDNYGDFKEPWFVQFLREKDKDK